VYFIKSNLKLLNAEKMKADRIEKFKRTVDVGKEKEV